MTEQLQLRRGTASQVAAFTGALGEIVVDTTNNRAVVNDGATVGGWPAARLAEVIANTRSVVADAPYSVLVTDRSIAFTTLTAARVATLPAAASYPTGTPLIVFDESGACSSANTITLTRAGADTIDGATSAAIATAFGYLAVQSNGANKWTILAQPGVSAAPSRTVVADAPYTALTSDQMIAYTALTAARVVTLCAASSYPTGTRLTIVDETGACSATMTISVARAGADTIDGATGFVIAAAYGGLEIESNGSNGWTILSPRPNHQVAVLGIGTAPDPSNVLSAYGASALLNGAANFNLTINKGGATGASADTASLIFEDGFSGRAQMGLNGSDNFSFKVSPNGSSWSTAIAIDAATGVPTFGNQRTAVSNAAYTALTTDRSIAYTALTAARIVTLPASSAYPTGTTLTVFDESGACSATDTITLSRAGSDTIDGAASAVITTAYGYLALQSNGAGKWTIVDSTPSSSSSSSNFSGDTGSGGAAGLVPAPAAGSAADGFALLAGGAFGAVPAFGGFVNKFRNASFDIPQRGASGSVAAAGNAYTIDGWILSPTGAAGAWSQVWNTNLPGNSLKLAAASGLTALTLAHRIESYTAVELLTPYGGQQACTVQFLIYNGTSASITPSLSTGYASARDNFSTVTADLAATSLQTIAAGAVGVIAYTLSPNVNLANGYSLSLSFGSALNASSGSIQIGRADFRVTPGIASGLNNSPPPPELRSLSSELSLNERYFQTSYDPGVTPGAATHSGMTPIGNATDAASDGYGFTLRTPLRIPSGTLNLWDGAGNANKTSNYSAGAWTDNNKTISFVSIGAKSALVTLGATSTDVQWLHYAVSAEL